LFSQKASRKIKRLSRKGTEYEVDDGISSREKEGDARDFAGKKFVFKKVCGGHKGCKKRGGPERKCLRRQTRQKVLKGVVYKRLLL